MANLLLKDQILVLSRQTATRAAVDFINIPSNRAATLQPEVVLFYFRKDTAFSIHQSVIVINIIFMHSIWMDISSQESVLACC